MVHLVASARLRRGRKQAVESVRVVQFTASVRAYDRIRNQHVHSLLYWASAMVMPQIAQSELWRSLCKFH